MEMNILDVHILLEIEKREEYNYHIFKSSDSEVGNLSSSYRELLVLQHQKKWFTNCRQDLIYFTDSCSFGKSFCKLYNSKLSRLRAEVQCLLSIFW